MTKMLTLNNFVHNIEGSDKNGYRPSYTLWNKNRFIRNFCSTRFKHRVMNVLRNGHEPLDSSDIILYVPGGSYKAYVALLTGSRANGEIDPILLTLNLEAFEEITIKEASILLTYQLLDFIFDKPNTQPIPKHYPWRMLVDDLVEKLYPIWMEIKSDAKHR